MGKRAITLEEAVFDINTAVGVGAQKDVSRFETQGASLMFRVAAGTVRMQASNDGTTWIDILTPVSADAFLVLDYNYRYLRVETTVGPADADAVLHAHELIY